MNGTVTAFKRCTDSAAPSHEIESRMIGDITKTRLAFNDRVEVAAIGDIEHELTEIGNGDTAFCVNKEGRDIGEPHLLDLPVRFFVGRNNQPRRCVETKKTRMFR